MHSSTIIMRCFGLRRKKKKISNDLQQDHQQQPAAPLLLRRKSRHEDEESVDESTNFIATSQLQPSAGDENITVANKVIVSIEKPAISIIRPSDEPSIAGGPIPASNSDVAAGKLSLPVKTSHRSRSACQKKQSDQSACSVGGDSGISASSSPARATTKNDELHASSELFIQRKQYKPESGDQNPVFITSLLHADVPTIIVHAVSPTFSESSTKVVPKIAQSDSAAHFDASPSASSSHLLYATTSDEHATIAHNHHHATVGRCQSCAEPTAKSSYAVLNPSNFDDDFPSSSSASFSSSPYFENRFPHHRKSEPTILSYAATLAQSAVSPYEAPAWLIHRMRAAGAHQTRPPEEAATEAANPAPLLLSISTPSIPVAILAEQTDFISVVQRPASTSAAAAAGDVARLFERPVDNDGRQRRSFSVKHIHSHRSNGGGARTTRDRSAERFINFPSSAAVPTEPENDEAETHSHARQIFHARTSTDYRLSSTLCRNDDDSDVVELNDVTSGENNNSDKKVEGQDNSRMVERQDDDEDGEQKTQVSRLLSTSQKTDVDRNETDVTQQQQQVAAEMNDKSSTKQQHSSVEKKISMGFKTLNLKPLPTLHATSSAFYADHQSKPIDFVVSRNLIDDQRKSTTTFSASPLNVPTSMPVTMLSKHPSSSSAAGERENSSSIIVTKPKLIARKSAANVIDSGAGVPQSTQSSPTKSPTKARRTWRKVFLAIRLHNNFCRAHFTAPVAGHRDSVRVGAEPGTILKRFNDNEWSCLKQLMSDPFLRPFVPQLLGLQRNQSMVQPTIEAGIEKPDVFIRMADLLYEFEQPCVMDCKIGVRTYLESELEKARKKPVARPDMYQKMVSVDADAPTPDEHASQSVVKARYMMWREQMSSSSTLGFRVEGMLLPGAESQRDFKKIKLRHQVKQTFDAFTRCVWLPPSSSSPSSVPSPGSSSKKPSPTTTKIDAESKNLSQQTAAAASPLISGSAAERFSSTSSIVNDAVPYDYAYILGRYLTRLEQLRAALELSPFFASHEVIGSSLLFVHDHTQANVWMIDFVNTTRLPSGVDVTHRNEWIEGNHEDGYLTGLDNIISVFQELYEKYAATTTSTTTSSATTSPTISTCAPSSGEKNAAAASSPVADG